MNKKLLKLIISYNEYKKIMDEFIVMIKKLNIDYVYGIPRGGLPIATHISHYLNKQLIINENQLKTYDKVLIVDDINDSGETLNNIKNKYKNKTHGYATLFKKPRSFFSQSIYCKIIKNDCWVVFPWELSEEPPNKDYMLKYDNNDNTLLNYEEIRKKYNELLMAVINKYPNETRHQTALRYIQSDKQQINNCAKGEGHLCINQQ